MFIFIKVFTAAGNKAMALRKKKEEEEKKEEPAPEPSNEEVLLTEIRDLLKEQNQK